MSATEPSSAAGGLFGSSRSKSDPMLHALIDGESMLNGAVAIVLFSSLSSYDSSENADVSLLSFSVLGHSLKGRQAQ